MNTHSLIANLKTIWFDLNVDWRRRYGIDWIIYILINGGIPKGSWNTSHTTCSLLGDTTNQGSLFLKYNNYLWHM